MTETTPHTADSRLLTELGIVVKTDSKFAYVEAQRTGGCNGCSASGTCGTASLSRYFNRKSNRLVRVNNELLLQPGEQVKLMLDESQLIKQALLAYGLPLLGLFLFAILFQWLAKAFIAESDTIIELLSIVGGGLGLVFGWLYTHYYYRPVLPVVERVEVKESNS